MKKVTFRAAVKYGRRCFYPSSPLAELFCKLILRSGKGRDYTTSLADWQLEIIKQLGFAVESTDEVQPRTRRLKPEQRVAIRADSRPDNEIAESFGISAYTVKRIKQRLTPYDK